MKNYMEVDISKNVNRFLKFGLVGLLLIAFVAAAGVWYYQRGHLTMTVADAQINGKVVHARSRANGKVTELLVADGDMVEAGKVVARLQVRVSPDQIAQLEKNVELTKQNLSELQNGVTVSRPVATSVDSVSSEEARAHLERMEQLFSMGAVSARQRDEAAEAYEASLGASVSVQTYVQAASPQAIQFAEMQVRQAEMALAAARQESQATDITAPVGGTVYLSDVGVDSEVRPGQIIISIGDAANIWLEAYVDPSRADGLRLGQFVSYTVEGGTLTGSIEDITAPQTEKTMPSGNTEGVEPENPHAGKYVIRISLPEKRNSMLRPGSRAIARISLD